MVEKKREAEMSPLYELSWRDSKSHTIHVDRDEAWALFWALDESKDCYDVNLKRSAHIRLSST